MFYEIKIFLLSKSITKNSQQYQRCMTWLTVHRHIWLFVVIYDFFMISLMVWNACCRDVDEDVNGRRRIILSEGDNNNEETRDEEWREKLQKIIIMRSMLEFLMLKIMLQLMMILMITFNLWITLKQNDHTYIHRYGIYISGSYFHYDFTIYDLFWNFTLEAWTNVR